MQKMFILSVITSIRYSHSRYEQAYGETVENRGGKEKDKPGQSIPFNKSNPIGANIMNFVNISAFQETSKHLRKHIFNHVN